MTTIALVMAGGKGTRMNSEKEKPLVSVGGKPMIEHILNSLRNAKKIDEIVVAVSRHTPGTAEAVKSYRATSIETPGEDYVSDMQCAVKRLGPHAFLIISADLPLITSEIVDQIVARYEQSGEAALVVAVPAEIRERIGLDSEYSFELDGIRLVPAGINMIDGKRIDEGKLEQEIFTTDRQEVAVNVNTTEALFVAEQMFQHRKHGLAYR